MNLSENEFACYLLWHASYADLKLHSKELVLLHKNFGEEILDKTKKLYDSHSDYQKIQFLKEKGKQFLASNEDKESLAHRLIKIYYSDGEFHILEKNQIINLRSVL